MSANQQKLLTTQEVADLLRISRSTIWRWCVSGKLEAVKVGRNWRIPREEIERMLGSHQNQSTI